MATFTFAKTSAEQRQANFEDLAKPIWNTANGNGHNQSKPPQTETQTKKLEADFSDPTKPT